MSHESVNFLFYLLWLVLRRIIDLCIEPKQYLSIKQLLLPSIKQWDPECKQWSFRNEGSGTSGEMLHTCTFCWIEVSLSHFTWRTIFTAFGNWKNWKNWRFWEVRNQIYYSIFPKCQERRNWHVQAVIKTKKKVKKRDRRNDFNSVSFPKS